MRLRLDRLSEAVRSRRNWALVMLLGSVPLIVFALFCFAMVIMSVTDPRADDRGAETFCVIAGSLIPLTGAGSILFARARYDRGTRELQALFTESNDEGRIDRAALEAKGWSRDRADAVLLDALAHGLLTDESGTSMRPGAMIPSHSPSPNPNLQPVALPPPAPLPGAVAYVPSTPPQAVQPLQYAPMAQREQGQDHRVPLRGTPPAGATPATGQHYAQPGPALAAMAPRNEALAQTRAARLGSDRPLPPPSVLTGRVLKGTYLVEESLGQGGMGAVWAARHLRTGKRYAVKTLLSSERFSRDSILRFEREARAASGVGHAGIVGVHDFDRTDDGLHFLVMDLLQGETLENRLARSGRLPWSDARRTAVEVSEALAAAHHAGILHRDLKPANVFLAQIPGIGERAVLVDFGLAKPIEESASQRVTSTGAVVGTALYMSPEQARGEKLDVRSDVYGLAAMVYEMIAGVPPFLGSNAIAVMTMVLAEQPVAPSVLARGVPPELDALLLRSLSKHADDRPQDVPQFAAALQSIA